MRQEGGRPFGLILGVGVCIGSEGEGLVSEEVWRLILRCAQNDKRR